MSKRKSAVKIIGMVLLLICVWVGSFSIVAFSAQRTVVKGISMEPSYHEGDQLIVNKLSVKFIPIERNDVITVTRDDGTKIIKRVVALPGETVQITNGLLYINGEAQVTKFENMNDPGCAKDPITLKSDEYFVLGDNRNNSADSRMHGPIRKDQIIGKVAFKMHEAN